MCLCVNVYVKEEVLKITFVHSFTHWNRLVVCVCVCVWLAAVIGVWLVEENSE